MTVVSLMGVIKGEPAAPVNDSGAYYILDEHLQPVECNRAEWAEFQKSGADVVAQTNVGTFASVTTTFDGRDDGFDPDDPHMFTTMVYIPRLEHSEAEGHRTWHEAEAAHRRRVEELKGRLKRWLRAQEPQLDLL